MRQARLHSCKVPVALWFACSCCGPCPFRFILQSLHMGMSRDPYSPIIIKCQVAIL